MNRTLDMQVHQAWKQKDKLITISNITHSNKLVFLVGFATERKLKFI